MNIIMITNTYKPHVGGVAASVDTFVQEYRRKGHRVLVVAPEFENTPSEELDIFRLPALQKFNGSDFSVAYPVPVFLSRELANFAPDIVHSHHPFLLGDTALRVSALQNIPVVYTHHTMYEQYTHYVPGDSPLLQRFVIELATGYANLCHGVIAPSESIAEIIRERGVVSPIRVIPTGVDLAKFSRGDGAGIRHSLGIPSDWFLVGYAGRLAPEKNLRFLAHAVSRFLARNPKSGFLVVGSGISEADIRSICRGAGVENRLFFTQALTGQLLVDAYHSMDLFAFASCSETQGLVLVEAMAAGLPVVALDAPGAREVLRNRLCGRLLNTQSIDDFASVLEELYAMGRSQLEEMGKNALNNVQSFDTSASAKKALSLYGELISSCTPGAARDESALSALLRAIEEEWNLWANRVAAVTEAALGGDSS